MKLHRLLHGLILAALSVATVSAADPPVGRFGQPDDFEVSLVPDVAEICVGEPVFLSFVLKNRTGENLRVAVGGDYRNKLGRPESFRVQMIDAAGHPVPIPDAGQTMGGLSSTPQVLPHGSYSFRLLLPDWAIVTEPGTYVIRAERPVKPDLFRRGLEDQPADPSLPTFKAETTLAVLPRDAERLGRVIAALGEKTARLRDSTLAREPMDMLLRLDDPRTVPYFLAWLERKEYSMEYEALDGLARYRTDAALEGLKRGLTLLPEEISRDTKPTRSDPYFDDIRYAAALALARSPHPGALPYLLAQESNSSPKVRWTILSAARKRLPRAEAIPIFQRLAKDPDPEVSAQAHRYLDELAGSRESSHP